MKKNPQIALLGNPNSGKTAVFNQLTGLSQKVSNYPGVTVEKHIGTISISESKYDLIDYPGIYGIIPNSLDEEIVCNKWKEHLFGKKNNITFLWPILMFQSWLENQ